MRALCLPGKPLPVPHPQVCEVSERAPRGVYEQPYVGVRGERYFVAVDRAGRRILDATVPPGVAETPAVVRALWHLLNEFDPPRLTLLA